MGIHFFPPGAERPRSETFKPHKPWKATYVTAAGEHII
jgi:hypothetical protein